MPLFKKKQKIGKEIYGGAWGHLVSEHKIDVDTLSREMRCVEKEGLVNGVPVTLLRVFRLKDVEQTGITLDGWETFNEHPELVLFEGYLTRQNKAYLTPKQSLKK